MNEVRYEEGEFKSFEEEIYWRYMKRISFFTTFSSDSQHNLKIPKKFADNMRSNLLHTKMTLRGPSGVNWEVDMIGVGDDFFLQDGWQEFAEAYSLQENDVLIFKYDRNSTFSVKIFSGECEKIAAYFVKKCGHASPAVENQKKRSLGETEDDDEVRTTTKKSRMNAEIEPVRSCVTMSKKVLSNRKHVQSAANLVRKKPASRSMMGKKGRDSRDEAEPDKQREQSSVSNDEVPIQNGFEIIAVPAKRAEAEPTKQQKRKSLSNNEVPRQSGFENIVLPVKRGETELAKQPDISLKKKLISPGMKDVASPGARLRQSTSLCGSADIEYISNRRPVTNEEKRNAMRKAALELGENSFFVALPISSCCKHFNLKIPARFAAAHLGLKNREVYLYMGKKKWITKFIFSTGGLCSGWKKFALDNNLEESDVCLFKLVNQTSGEPVMLDVTIFRVVDEVTPPTLSIVK